MPTHAVFGQDSNEALIRAIASRGYTPILLPPHPLLPEQIATHPDALLFFAPDAVYTTQLYRSVAEKELRLLSEITDRPIRICRAELGTGYHHEILLNAVLIGTTLLCHPPDTAAELTQDPKYSVCAVRQGYVKCSVVPISENALITADVSIAKAAEKHSVSVLLLSENGCILNGYDTGFLGGACSYAPYATETSLYFCGNLETHPEVDSVSAFCRLHGKEPISLTDAPLTDVGTVFLI